MIVDVRALMAGWGKKSRMELTAKQIQKYQKKSIPQLLKMATEVFNRYIRQRDDQGGFFTCISCRGVKPLSQMHAGHFMSAGHNGMVRFNEDNVNGQCVRCNTFLHGNLAEYRMNLILKIGQEKVDLLESSARSVHKWDRFGLVHVIETYKEKLK